MKAPLKRNRITSKVDRPCDRTRTFIFWQTGALMNTLVSQTPLNFGDWSTGQNYESSKMLPFIQTE
ncbi:hypothetical protein PSPTOT1_3560 [Pseudomonas syringae pv. tomato T1]|nr:hypothetical protein PSPTOT1_3560 [Pseudomonas syringae pv. tomato T1]